MIWRLFKGRSTTTKEVSSPVQETKASSTLPNAEQSHVPSLNAFKFEAASVATDPVDGETAVDMQPAPDTPGDVATVVREKSRRRRGVRAAHRGVRPLLIPSLQETAVRLRAFAVSLGGRKPSEAVEYWRAFLTLRPRESEGWFSFGRCLLVSGAEVEAESAFQRAVELDKTHSLSWAALAYISERRDALPDAALLYARAVEYDRENLEFLSAYERLLEATGDGQTADLVREQIDDVRRKRQTAGHLR